MTATRDPDEILAAWLEEGPTTLPSQTRRAIDVALPTTVQRRPFFGWPGRSEPMNPFARPALGAIVIAILAVGGLAYFTFAGGPSAVGGPSPTRAPTASPTFSPAPPLISPQPVDTTGWVPFTSERYGYSLSRPSDWSAQPATRTWSLDVDASDWLSPAQDVFRSADRSIRLSVFSAPKSTGMTGDDWMASYFAKTSTVSTTPCAQNAEDLGGVTVDGHPATFVAEPETADCGATTAFVEVGDRMYVFVVWRGGYESMLETFLTTVRFDPIVATGLTRYHSARYGFDISYPDDWILYPATRDWTWASDGTDALSPAHEDLRSPAADVRLSAWSIPLDPGTTIESPADLEAWATDFCQRSGDSPCTGIHDRAVPLCLERRDCHPGLLVPFDTDVQAYFSGGIYPAGHMIVVSVWRGDTDPSVQRFGGSQRLLEAFLSTMQVWPASTPVEQRQVRALPTAARP